MFINFFQKYKKIIFITIFFFITIFLGILLYKIFFKNLISPTTPILKEPIKIATSTTGDFPTSGKTEKEPYDENPDINLPESYSKKTITDKITSQKEIVKRLNNNPSKNLSLNSNGKNINYYNTDDNKFYKIDKNGNISILSNKTFYNVEKTTWSPKDNKAIIEYPDGSNIVYDFDKQKQITLPKHWEDFDFSPAGNEIINKSIGLDPENRWLLISNSDGTKVTPIDKIGNNSKYIHPSWSPNNKSIALQIEGIGFNRQKIYFIGKNNENFKSTTIEGRGFEHLWSPVGDKLLYSVYSSDNNMKPKLWVVNAEGNDIGTSRKNLNIETWAHKCNFSTNNEIYCAVPTELENGSGIFTDFAETTTDQLYKINIATKLKKIIITPENNTNISNIIISQDKKYLYYTDALTKNIYQVKL